MAERTTNQSTPSTANCQIISAAAPAPIASVVPPGLWESLAAPDAAVLRWLTARIPGLDGAAVRVLTLDAGDALFSAAAAQGQTPLDFFTDPAFRTRDVFHIPQQTLAKLFARYELRSITPASGTTIDGRSFTMQALVVGNGRVDMLYDLDRFSFDNKILENDRYTLAGHVSERIQGPGDMTIEGVLVKYGIIDPRVERITKISAARARVDTNYGSRTKPLLPIRRRN